MSEDKDYARTQALAQVSNIQDMVAALECDYERLEELREERGAINHEIGMSGQDSAERETLHASLRAWDKAYAEELSQLSEAAGGCKNEGWARERITEDALSVEVRSGWSDAGDTLTPSEFRIVLCTGGPHVELVGELDDNLQPRRVRILYRDWGTSGELFDFDREAILTYCRQFYFGE